MPKLLDIRGVRYGRLVATKLVGRRWGKAMWEFDCDCGNTIKATSNTVREGHTLSCGCLRKEFAAAKSKDAAAESAKALTKHGDSQPGGKNYREYCVWKTMWQRCDNPNSPDYPLYGARGIKVCEEWRDFNVFLKHMGEKPAGKYSIDRMNNSLGYQPGNCRWATDSEQANNRRPRTKKPPQGIKP